MRFDGSYWLYRKRSHLTLEIKVLVYKAKNFTISHNVSKPVEGSTRITDNPNHQANILDLAFRTHPDNYQLSKTSPLGKSDHKLIPATSQQTISPKIVSGNSIVWYYRSAEFDELKDFYLSFPWRNVCFRSQDPSSFVESVTEIIRLGTLTSRMVQDGSPTLSSGSIKNATVWCGPKIKHIDFGANQPIPKKGKKTIPADHRPTALLSVISKVMEKAINIELINIWKNSK
ncbi:hypothetical protein JTB14_010694 [Gonioctena quinquepunctata]|nr:hypothetical protein JTB14_010694 [Gonioctena quinquepunctata]